MTLKINRVPDSLKDYVCTKFGQNPLKDFDPSVHKDVTEGRMEGRKDRRKDGSIIISLCNFVGEGITSNHSDRIHSYFTQNLSVNF